MRRSDPQARGEGGPGAAPGACVIRPAATADLAAIFAIYDPEVMTGTATFETVPKSDSERLGWFNAHASSRHPLLVACDGPIVTGWAGASRWWPRAAYDRAVETSVYIHQDHRGRGIGRALMLELIGRCRAGGAGVLLARIVEGNPASLSLHESLGFRTVGITRRIGEKFGRLLDVRIMDLHLDGG
jgi:L-amino acid N-acyltransferase YncA